MNPHRLLNEVGANYSAYRTRNFVGVLIRHLIEHNTYALVGRSFSGYGLLSTVTLAAHARRGVNNYSIPPTYMVMALTNCNSTYSYT